MTSAGDACVTIAVETEPLVDAEPRIGEHDVVSGCPVRTLAPDQRLYSLVLDPATNSGYWRGPVWVPVNALLIRALLSFYLYYGDNFKIECPTGSGHQMNLFEVAREIANRMARIFLRDESGRRPVYGGTEKFQTDPHWRDHILFYEYFHGDNGAGLGASHQTGWTGVVARLIQFFGTVDSSQLLAGGRSGIFAREERREEKHVAA